MLVEFKASQFLFDKPYYQKVCLIDKDFQPSLIDMNDCAREHGVFIYTTSSFRKYDKPVQNAIVEPIKMSNHFVGHAIDCNYLIDGKFYNSKDIERVYTADPNHKLSKFISCCKSKGLRFGGDFRIKDIVHWDDALNLKQQHTYKILFSQYQK